MKIVNLVSKACKLFTSDAQRVWAPAEATQHLQIYAYTL